MITIVSACKRALVGAAVVLSIPAAVQAQRLAPAALGPVTYAPAVTAPAAAQPLTLGDAPAITRAVADSAATTAVNAREAAAAMAPRDHADVGPNIGLMIIGGAGIITGAVVGGKSGAVISVAGAVVGLYGLYRYLR